MRAEAETRDKLSRLALFETDLELLGLSLDDAAALDEKGLRKVFHERSRELHPDVAGQQGGVEGAADGKVAAVPSVYELNAAYVAVRKLL